MLCRTGPQQLWSVKPDGSDKKQLTECEGISNWPTVTPDGKRVVFSNSREDNYEIYTMNLDGSEEQRLTQNHLMDIRPAVSPDGSRIAFTSTRDGNYDVYVMDIDGKNVKRITHSDEREDYPAWHPDGQHLVYVAEHGGRLISLCPSAMIELAQRRFDPSPTSLFSKAPRWIGAAIFLSIFLLPFPVMAIERAIVIDRL